MAKKSKSRSRAQQTNARAKAAASRSQGAGTTPSATKPKPKASTGPANRARKLTPAPPPRKSGVRSGLGRPVIIGIVAVVLLGGYFGYQWLQSNKSAGPLVFASPAPSIAPNPDLAGLQTGPPPWDAALGSLRERLTQLGLPVLTAEDTSLHFHAHLDVKVDGDAVVVPDDIGRNEAAGYLTVIHTHDTSGLIHIESPKGHEYTLGQVFDVWGVRFTRECLGGDCNEGDRQVRVYVDGKFLQSDPRRLILEGHQEIFVTFGTIEQRGKVVPSKYAFSLGT